MIYKIYTPNKNYDGITLNLKFENGMAETSDEYLKTILISDYKYSYDEVIIEEVTSPTLDLDTLEYKELQALAKEKGLKHTGIKKEDLLESIKNLKVGE